MTGTDLTIKFTRADFEDILVDAGIDPDTVTWDEWRKFTDYFCDGCSWHEVAIFAADALYERRRETA